MCVHTVKYDLKEIWKIYKIILKNSFTNFKVILSCLFSSFWDSFGKKNILNLIDSQLKNRSWVSLCLKVIKCELWCSEVFWVKIRINVFRFNTKRLVIKRLIFYTLPNFLKSSCKNKITKFSQYWLWVMDHRKSFEGPQMALVPHFGTPLIQTKLFL